MHANQLIKTARHLGLSPRRRMLKTSVVALFAGLLSSITTNAQSTFGKISGSVKDPAGTAVAGATITATMIDDHGTARTAVSAGDGMYAIADVPPGMYSVTAQKQGYTDFTISAVQVKMGETATSDIAMLSASSGTAANAQPELPQTPGQNLLGRLASFGDGRKCARAGLSRICRSRVDASLSLYRLAHRRNGKHRTAIQFFQPAYDCHLRWQKW